MFTIYTCYCNKKSRQTDTSCRSEP